MYVSPFHGIDGHYDLLVPRPGRRAPRDGDAAPATTARFHAPPSSASRTLDASRLRSGPRRAPRCPADPRSRHLALGTPAAGSAPTHPPTTGRRLTMTTTTPSPPGHQPWPGLTRVPHRPQGRRVRARSPGSCSRPPSSPARVECPTAPHRAARPRRPRSWCCTARTSSSRASARDGLIGFGESYMTGAWDSADLGGC